MAEEMEKSAGPQTPAQVLALTGAGREKADAFLELQMEEMRQRNPYEISHFRLRRFSDWAKAALEFSLGLIALALVGALGVMVWNAAHDNGLVIEPFSVPPDLATRGLTGQVVATQMLDNLSALQSGQSTVRAAGSYTNNWGNDLKVEIPETGISIGQVDTYLHQFLGHQTHITGEVVRTSTGITVTARAGNAKAQRFSGPETDFDVLMQQATEAVYAGTQPYRYGVRFLVQGRYAQALAFWSDTVRTQPPSEQVWDYTGMFNVLAAQHRIAEAVQAARTAVTIDPDFAWGWTKMASGAGSQGRSEANLAASRTVAALLDRGVASGLRPDAVQSVRQEALINIDFLLGDHAEGIRKVLARNPELTNVADPARQVQAGLTIPGSNMTTVIGGRTSYANNLIEIHDLAAAQRILAAALGFVSAVRAAVADRDDVRGGAIGDTAEHNFRALEMNLAFAGEDWPKVVRLAGALEAQTPTLTAAYTNSIYPPIGIWPLRAYAEARLGRFAVAHALIDRTPSDCDICLRMRGKIAAQQKNTGAADFWFARAVQLAPSIPFAYADWGQMLLERGDADGAIAQFAASNRKGPHFADPLEGWGEALMAKNQSHLALEKFAEAEKYAPNWGRLHLKWGEALTYSGKAAEARAHFTRAAALDLTPSEKSELSKVNRP